MSNYLGETTATYDDIQITNDATINNDLTVLGDTKLNTLDITDNVIVVSKGAGAGNDGGLALSDGKAYNNIIYSSEKWTFNKNQTQPDGLLAQTDILCADVCTSAFPAGINSAITNTHEITALTLDSAISIVPVGPATAYTFSDAVAYGRYIYIAGFDDQTPNHAYVWVMDITDTVPVLVKTIEYSFTSSLKIFSIIAQGNYLVVCIKRIGIKVYDIRDPYALDLLHEYSITGTGQHYAMLKNNYLYVLSTDAGTTGLRTLQLIEGEATPTLTDYASYATAEGMILSYEQKYILTGETTGGNYRLWDISNNPAVPVDLGLKSSFIVNNQDGFILNNILYSITNSVSRTLNRTDISDPLIPVFDTSELYTSNVENIEMYGNYILASSETDGLYVINPDDLTIICQTTETDNIINSFMIDGFIYAVNNTGTTIDKYTHNGEVITTSLKSGYAEIGELDIRQNINVSHDINCEQNIYCSSVNTRENSNFKKNIYIEGDFQYKKGFMEVYVNNNTTETAVAIINTWYKANFGAGALENSHNVGWTSSTDAKCTYSPADGRSRHAHSGVTFSYSSPSNNQTLEFGIFHNGVLEDASLVRVMTRNAGDFNSTAIHVIGNEYVDGDYIEFSVKNTTSTANVTIRDFNIFSLMLPNLA